MYISDRENTKFALKMKNAKNKKKSTKKSRDESQQITSDASVGNLDGELPMGFQFPRYSVVRRVVNKKIEPDQSTLQFSMPLKQEIQQEEQRFKIFKFNHQKPNYIVTPNINLINPLDGESSILTNGAEHDIMFKQNILSKMLTTQATRSFLDETLDYSLTGSSFAIRPRKISTEIKEATRKLFQSILKPEEAEEENQFFVRENPIKGQTMSSNPAPASINVPGTNIFNHEISQFEREKLLNPLPFFRPGYNFKRKVQLCSSSKEESKYGKFIFKLENLKLSAGEFVLVEYIDDNPIVQPIVGMCSNLTVLTSDPEINSHNFDPRIPLEHINSQVQQPFLAKLPDTPILCMINQVAISALYPHDLSSNTTDFILCVSGKTCTLHRLPPIVYASTAAESRIIMKNNQTTRIENYLQPFSQMTGVNPVELCRNRSIIKWRRKLAMMGIEHTNLPNIAEKSILGLIKQLPSHLRAGIVEYIELLKKTPWHRSYLIARVRLGMIKAASEFLVEEVKFSQYKEVLQQKFQNHLAMISKTGNDTEDNIYFDLDISETEDDDLEEILEGVDNTEVSRAKSSPFFMSMKTLINWEELVGEVHGWREAMVTRNYTAEDGIAKCELTFSRDPVLINSKKKLQRKINRKNLF